MPVSLPMMIVSHCRTVTVVAVALVAASALAIPGAGGGASVAAQTATATAAATAAPAAQPAVTSFIGRTTSQVRLRGAAEQDGPILLLIPADAPIVLLGRAENGYYPAAWNRIAGWVETGAIETPPLSAARGPEAIRELLDRQEALADAQINVHAEPAPDADPVAMMNRHEPAAFTGRVSGGYLEVVADGETGWVEGRFLSAPGAGGAPREYKREEIIQIIYEAADYYHQSREDMLQVARCESDLTPTATDEIGGAYGLFQFKPFTWDDTPYADYDIFDPRANAFAAAWMWSVGNKDAWVCQ